MINGVDRCEITATSQNEALGLLALAGAEVDRTTIRVAMAGPDTRSATPAR